MHATLPKFWQEVSNDIHEVNMTIGQLTEASEFDTGLGERS